MHISKKTIWQRQAQSTEEGLGCKGRQPELYRKRAEGCIAAEGAEYQLRRDGRRDDACHEVRRAGKRFDGRRHRSTPQSGVGIERLFHHHLKLILSGTSSKQGDSACLDIAAGCADAEALFGGLTPLSLRRMRECVSHAPLRTHCRCRCRCRCLCLYLCLYLCICCRRRCRVFSILPALPICQQLLLPLHLFCPLQRSLVTLR